MLVDVNPEIADPRTVHSVISGRRRRSGALEGERIGKGLYLCTHWNFDDCLPGKWQKFLHDAEDYHVPFAVGGAKADRPWDAASEYGVCDSPEQFMELIGKHLDAIEDQEFVVSFVKLCKADEPPDGGWRWHKWGPYIGTQKQRCEYLAHEPEVEVVYTYHFYRRLS